MNGCETQDEKQCAVCGEVKSVEDFYRSRKAKSGRQSACKICSTARQKLPHNQEYRRDYAWRKCLERFSITQGRYDEMLERQSGMCAICHKPETGGTRLAVDHDHSCCDGDFSCGNCIRGLLCKRCNMAIGLLFDNPNTIASALYYVKGKR